MTRSSRVAAAAALLVAVTAVAARAQGEEDKKLGWSDAAELTFVSTAGNSEASTLGLENGLTRKWEGASLKIVAGALRAETTTTTREAVGSAADFRVRERSDSALTAEKYFLRAKYSRTVSERLIWFAGAGWDRNEFAGVANRYFAVGGIGHVWFDAEDASFQTDYGLTYTRQEDVIGGPSADDSFLGLQLGWDYRRRLTASTVYESDLRVDQNLDETSDLRADLGNSLSVSMSERLAVKLGLQLLYDNQPSRVSVPLVDPAGNPLGSVPVALEKLDSLFSVALVVAW